jgi:hypothetical protein
LGDPDIEVYGMDLGTGDKRKELLNSISLLEGKILSETEVDLEEIKNELYYAKMMLEGGVLDEAEEKVTKCQEMFTKRIRRYELLVNTIGKAKRLIMMAEEHDENPREAKNLVEKAEECLDKGEYKEGVAIALKAVESARDEIADYESWKTELDAWSD